MLDSDLFVIDAVVHSYNLDRSNFAVPRHAEPLTEMIYGVVGLVEMGLVEDVHEDEGDVVVALRLTTPPCHMLGHLFQQIDDQVGPHLGGRTVRVVTDNGLNWDPSMSTGRAREERERRRLALIESARSGSLPLVAGGRS